MHLCGVGASDGGGRIVGALGSPCGAIAGAMGYGLWVMGMGYGHGLWAMGGYAKRHMGAIHNPKYARR